MDTGFSGMGFAVGKVRGTRSFKVDKYGRLTGVSHPKVWKPGENIAECGTLGSILNLNAITAKFSYLLAANPAAPTVGELKEAKPVETIIPGEYKHNAAECSCGFYGFFDDVDDYKSSNTISAVVEGYGETVIGTRGFRSQKAKIVALCANQKKRKGESWPLVPWLASLDINTNSYMAGIGLPVGLILILLSPVAFFLNFIALGQTWGLAGIAGFPLGLFGVYLCLASFKSIDYKYDHSPARPHVELVRRNYPGIPVYSSYRKMVKDFPSLGRPEEPEISPATDPDFWSRVD